MQRMESLIDSYFTFHYGVGFAIGLVIFCGYMFLLRKQKKSQGQSVSKKEMLCGLALSIYMMLLLGGTLLNREVGDEYLIEWVPFWSYGDLFFEWNEPLASQIVYNVLVFIPWGFLLPEMFVQMRNICWVVGNTVILSFSIEIVQLVFKLGLFEFDDVFHNTLGAIIGYVLWRLSIFLPSFLLTLCRTWHQRVGNSRGRSQ
ncbi:MAG: VanZ family protein [Tyzzerella sp.]|nr:VanZ family protein [Tyzzerella sp.]